MSRFSRSIVPVNFTSTPIEITFPFVSPLLSREKKFLREKETVLLPPPRSFLYLSVLFFLSFKVSSERSE